MALPSEHPAPTTVDAARTESDVAYWVQVDALLPIFHTDDGWWADVGGVMSEGFETREEALEWAVVRYRDVYVRDMTAADQLASVLSTYLGKGEGASEASFRAVEAALATYRDQIPSKEMRDRLATAERRIAALVEAGEALQSACVMYGIMRNGDPSSRRMSPDEFYPASDQSMVTLLKALQGWRAAALVAPPGAEGAGG